MDEKILNLVLEMERTFTLMLPKMELTFLINNNTILNIIFTKLSMDWRK